jgi:hypothetical protein
MVCKCPYTFFFFMGLSHEILRGLFWPVCIGLGNTKCSLPLRRVLGIKRMCLVSRTHGLFIT